MIVKWIVVLLMGVLVWGFCMVQVEQVWLLVVDKVVVYQGQQGFKVWILCIGEVVVGEVLLQVEGLDYDWDCLIYKVKVEKSVRDSCYFIELNGSKYVILIVCDGWGEFYLFGEQQMWQVVYSEVLLFVGEFQVFLIDYFEQK